MTINISRWEPRTSVEDITTVSDPEATELLDTICGVECKNNDKDCICDVPSNLELLDISPKLLHILKKFNGKKIFIQELK